MVSMRLVKAVAAKPRTALAAWTVGFNFGHDFLVVEGAAAFDASHTVAALTFPFQQAQSVACVQLPDDVELVDRQRLSVESFYQGGVVGNGVRCSSFNNKLSFCRENREKLV